MVYITTPVFLSAKSVLDFHRTTFSKNSETAAKESTLNVLSLRRRNETWL